MNNIVSHYRHAFAVLLFCSGLAARNAYAQEQQAPIDFVYSYATFAGEDNTSLVEFSFKFSEDGLTYVNGLGELHVELQLFDTMRSPKASYVWKASRPIPKEGVPGKMISELRRFQIAPGTYIAALRLVDGGNSQRSDSTRFVMHVRAVEPGSFGISDLELITEMAPATENETENLPQRNGYILMRNVDAVVTTPDFRLNSYIEIYNSHRLPGSNFTVSYLIADTAGQGLYRRDTLLPKSAGGRLFDVNQVVVSGLPTGWYIVAARVFNGPRSTASDSIETLRSFFVYNPMSDSGYVIDNFVFDSSSGGMIDPIYAGIKEEELNLEFRKASFIMSKRQKSIWAQLEGPEPKGRFLTRFWLSMDDDPATPENPFRDDYYDRIAYAKKVYTTPLHPNGWDSDQGRVSLQYGKPDQIDRHPNDHNHKPYEIWHYSTHRYDFVFVDRSQTDSYQLVHSTAPNEISYPNWQREYATLHKQMYDNGFDQSDPFGD